MENRGVPLPAIPAAASITNALPPAIERELARFTDIALEAPDWPTRAAALDLLIARQMDMPRDDIWRFRLEATAALLTSALEQLGERDIASLSQAMAYRYCAHAAWRAAAMRWLAADDGDIGGWMNTHPALGLFALRMASLEIKP